MVEFLQLLSKCFRTKNKSLKYFYTETSEDDTILPKHVELCENFDYIWNT
jgi:hypothetical protein